MPTRQELIKNKPLNGTELGEIIMRNVADMIRRDGLFAAHMAYGRVAFKLNLKVMLDNVTYPEHKLELTSQNPARNEPDPQMRQVFAPPLENPTPDAVIKGTEREVKIDSPNATRLEYGMPVEIAAIDKNTGQVKTEKVYVEDQNPQPKPKPNDKDVTGQAKAEWSQ